jgi:hypothetical protein
MRARRRVFRVCMAVTVLLALAPPKGSIEVKGFCPTSSCHSALIRWKSGKPATEPTSL